MELKFKYRFEAAHRFTQSASPACMTPHGHTWYATLHLKSLVGLNAQDMSVEFSQLKSNWKEFISSVFDHSYLCNHKDVLIEPILASNPNARLLPFPGDPTTELIALLMFSKAEQFLQKTPWQKNIQVAGITIDETPTNSIHCDAAFFKEYFQQYSSFEGWWSMPGLLLRTCRRVEISTN